MRCSVTSSGPQTPQGEIAASQCLPRKRARREPSRRVSRRTIDALIGNKVEGESTIRAPRRARQDVFPEPDGLACRDLQNMLAGFLRESCRISARRPIVFTRAIVALGAKWCCTVSLLNLTQHLDVTAAVDVSFDASWASVFAHEQSFIDRIVGVL